MSIPASAQNTMFEKIENNEIIKNSEEEVKNREEEVKNREEVTNEEIHDSDDDMIVISIRETYKNETNQSQEAKAQAEEKQEVKEEVKEEQEEVKKEQEAQEEAEAKSKQQGEELFFKVRDDMDKKKLFPIMPCNMVSAFVCAMENVEYLDIKDVERKALVIELVKCLAYINNEYGAKECFDYLFQNNMTDDIIKTIIDCTKSQYDINKYPHTNRNIVLSCVSLSKKVKNKTKPKIDLLDDLFEFNFKFSFCDLKRFFRIKDSSKSV